MKEEKTKRKEKNSLIDGMEIERRQSIISFLIFLAHGQ